jgi:hypothetical protein
LHASKVKNARQKTQKTCGEIGLGPKFLANFQKMAKEEKKNCDLISLFMNVTIPDHMV